MTGPGPKPRLALCMEYSLCQQGGTEVIVRALIEGCSEACDLVVVSDDTPDSVAASGLGPHITHHIHWNPARVGYRTARELADRLAVAGAQLAHFHFGGTFSWGNRWPALCPINPVARRGIRCISTVHSVQSPFEGYIGQHRPRIVKLALWPLAWGAKCLTLSNTCVEFAVSLHDLRILKRCAAPFARRLAMMYHSTMPEGTPPARASRKPVILCLGTYSSGKGQAILVEAFRRLAPAFPDWQLLFAGRVGDEAYFRLVEEAAGRAGLGQRIRLKRQVPKEEAAALLGAASVFAMPSLQEGLGLSLQEALLLGCPAVGSRAGGIPELIDDGSNGLLVAPGDPQALADGLAQLMRDPARRGAMSEAARLSVLRKGMTRERMIQNYIDAYRKAGAGIAGRAAGRP